MNTTQPIIDLIQSNMEAQPDSAPVSATTGTQTASATTDTTQAPSAERTTAAPVTETGQEQSNQNQDNDNDGFVFADATETQQQATAPTAEATQNTTSFDDYTLKEFGLKPDELKAKLSELNKLGQQPKKSEWSERIDELHAKGITNLNEAVKFLTLDIEGLSAKEALVSSLQLQQPNLSREQIEQYVDETYNQTDLATDSEKNVGTVKLEIDANKAKQYLSELRGEKLNPTNANAGQQTAFDSEAVLTEWNKSGNTEKALSFNTIDFPLELSLPTIAGNPETKKATFPIPISSEDKAYLAKAINDAVSNGQFEANAEGLEKATQYAKNLLILNNVNSYVQKAVGSALTQNNKAWAKLVNNPPKSANNGMPAQQTVNAEDAHAQAVLKMITGK